MKPRYRVVIERQTETGWLKDRLCYAGSIPTPLRNVEINESTTLEDVRAALNAGGVGVVELDGKTDVIIEVQEADGLPFLPDRVLQAGTKTVYMNTNDGEPSTSPHLPPDNIPHTLCSPEKRQTAAGTLRAWASMYRAKAADMDALARIADNLKPGSPEESALWDLAMRAR